MNVPNFMYLDIETVPSSKEAIYDLPIKPELSDVKIGNRKGEVAEAYRKEQLPSLISKWEEDCVKAKENAESEIRKESLDPLKAKVFCVGYAFDDSPTEIISGEESYIIGRLDYLISEFGQKVVNMSFVGYNIKDFDCEILLHRAVKYRKGKLFRYLKDANIYELSEMIKFNKYSKRYYKFDDILKFYGLPGKEDGIDGSLVYDYVKAGRKEEIYNYCAKDVDKNRLLFKRINDMYL
jgi:3'-5' exonuclease